MRAIIKRATVSTLFLTAVVMAEADGPDFYRVTGVENNDTLNVHNEPHVKAKVIGEINYAADCLKNLGCQGGLTLDESMNLSEKEKEAIVKNRPRWCKIEFDGMQGWVFGKYLAESGCKEARKP